MALEKDKHHPIRYLPPKVIAWSSEKRRLLSFLQAKGCCSPLARRRELLCLSGGCKGIRVILV